MKLQERKNRLSRSEESSNDEALTDNFDVYGQEMKLVLRSLVLSRNKIISIATKLEVTKEDSIV